MKNIVLLMGKSGSGKDTVTDYLVKNYNFKKVISYTTRPRRSLQENCHYFLSPAEFATIKDNLVAYTQYCGYEYGVTPQLLLNSDIYIIDPIGVETLLSHCLELDLNPIVVYLRCGDETLSEHMRARGDSEEDIQKRLQYDREAFRNAESYANLILDVDESPHPKFIALRIKKYKV